MLLTPLSARRDSLPAGTFYSRQLILPEMDTKPADSGRACGAGEPAAWGLLSLPISGEVADVGAVSL